MSLNDDILGERVKQLPFTYGATTKALNLLRKNPGFVPTHANMLAWKQQPELAETYDAYGLAEVQRIFTWTSEHQYESDRLAHTLWMRSLPTTGGKLQKMLRTCLTELSYRQGPNVMASVRALQVMFHHLGSSIAVSDLNKLIKDEARAGRVSFTLRPAEPGELHECRIFHTYTTELDELSLRGLLVSGENGEGYDGDDELFEAFEEYVMSADDRRLQELADEDADMPDEEPTQTYSYDQLLFQSGISYHTRTERSRGTRVFNKVLHDLDLWHLHFKAPDIKTWDLSGKTRKPLHVESFPHTIVCTEEQYPSIQAAITETRSRIDAADAIKARKMNRPMTLKQMQQWNIR